MLRLLLLILVVLEGSSAWAADICRAIALQDIPSLENPSSILKKGDYDTAITQYRVSKKDGQDSFCSHGGYCYPRHITFSGKRTEVLSLTNCKIGKKDSYNDDEFTYYEIEVNRSNNSTKALREDDLENRLLERGLCSGCAGNAADTSLKHPKSKCAKLVKQALKGDKVAIARLSDDVDICINR